MKLLFYENLSPKLPRLLETLFPGSSHVRDCGLKGFPDEDVWEYARKVNSLCWALCAGQTSCDAIRCIT